MKVSVVLATYNGEEFLKEQLESIRLQQLTPDEVIICDDCSKDNSQLIIKKFINEFQLQQTWHLIVNKKNLGYGTNFNEGMKQAKGKYIFLCDQDDIWKDNKILEMVEKMEQNSDINLLCCDYAPLVSSGDAPKAKKRVLREMNDTGKLEKVELNYHNFFIESLGCLMAVRKDFLDEIEPFWYEGWAHDEFLWKLAVCSNGCYRYHKRLIERRFHSNNVSMKKTHTVNTRLKYLRDLLKSHEATKKFAIVKKLSPKTKIIINRNIAATKLRIGLLHNKKWVNVVKLIPYMNCYHSKRSMVMEPLILFKEKR